MFTLGVVQGIVVFLFILWFFFKVALPVMSRLSNHRIHHLWSVFTWGSGPISFIGSWDTGQYQIGLRIAFGVLASTIFLVEVIVWIQCEWNRRKKRKVLKKLGDKARALRARLVASMPQRSPALSPAFRSIDVLREW